MGRENLSWRHLFSLLVTIAAGFAVWRTAQAPLPPEPPPRLLMHIHIQPPPAAPQPLKPPPPRKPEPQPTPKIVQAPAVNDPHPTLAAPPAAPAESQTVATAPPQPAPPAPPSPAPPAANASASLEAIYVARLHALVEAQKHYPTSRDAMLQQPRGAVSVWITIDRQGALVDAGIEQSSGSILNQAALQSVRRASYPSFPAELYAGQANHRFVVSLNYMPQ